MALPTLTAPEYEITLLSQANPVKFRPYLVREEKLLLMAQQGGDKKEIETAIKTIIRTCTFDAINVERLPSFDLEYIYLQLRAKSVNNVVETKFECRNMLREEKDQRRDDKDDGRCHATVPMKINLDDIKITTNEKHSKTILVSDTVGVTMQYPTADTIIALGPEIDPLVVLKVLEDCIENVYTTDGEVHEFRDQTAEDRQEFINSMNVKQLELIQEFFTTMPALVHTVNFVCPKCEYTEAIELRGLDSFFG